MVDKEVFLESAKKIGDRLIDSAIKCNSGCTWHVNIRDPKNYSKKILIKKEADGSIYQGTAGIALFFLELYRMTKESKYKSIAEEALEYAIDSVNNFSNSNFGFYCGRVGIAYVLRHASEVFDRPDFFDASRKTLEPLKGNEFNDISKDAISGGAGAIPALLKMAESPLDTFELDMAVKLGDNLINAARMEPKGWSWDGSVSNHRNLCSYAHGASGMAHAFLELYNYTDLEKYLYVAGQAFLYEQQFYDEAKGNWIDFRYPELSDYIYDRRIRELKGALAKKELKPFQNRYMAAWCQGAPGIGMARLRAYEITCNQVYKKEAQYSVEFVLKDLNVEKNYSLCHGNGGNSDVLIYASKLFDDKKLLGEAERIAMAGIEEYEREGNQWPCGPIGDVLDPSLMQGEAGIGYYLLRLYSNDIDSVLLLTSNKKDVSGRYNNSKDGLEEIRAQYVDRFWKNTKLFFQTQTKLEIKLPDFQNNLGASISDVESLLKKIELAIDNLDSDKQKKTMNIFLLEKLKYEKTLEITDFSEEYTTNIAKKDIKKICWNNDRFCLSKYTSVLKQAFNSQYKESEYLQSEDADIHYLFYRENNTIKVRQIALFAYWVFKNLERPEGFPSLLEKLKKAFRNEIPGIIELEKCLKEQLVNAYCANCIAIVN